MIEESSCVVVEKLELREVDAVKNVGSVVSMTAGAAFALSDTFESGRHDPIFDIVRFLY